MSSSAPPVSYPVGRSRFYLGMILLLWLIALVFAVTWWFQSSGAGWPAGLMAGLLPFMGGVLLWDWRSSPKGMLQWDGRSWSWTAVGDHPVLRVSVQLDLQEVLLLTCEMATGRRLWLWVQHATQPAQWLALRRALMAHARQ